MKLNRDTIELVVFNTLVVLTGIALYRSIKWAIRSIIMR